MEEHRTGGARKCANSIRRAATPLVLTPKPAEAVAYVGGYDVAPELAGAIVMGLASTGITVCFGTTDVKAGRALAQRSGAQHYPMADDASAMARVLALRGRLDYTLIITLEVLVVKFGDISVTINRVGYSNSELADMIAVLTLPAVRNLVKNLTQT